MGEIDDNDKLDLLSTIGIYANDISDNEKQTLDGSRPYFAKKLKQNYQNGLKNKPIFQIHRVEQLNK